MQLHSLLCESCGYPIDSLPKGDRCPECGAPAAESYPSARQGTTWQRANSVSRLPWAWLVTNFAMLFRPRASFRGMAVRPGYRLLWVNLLIAAGLLVDPWVGVLIGDPARNWQTQGIRGLATYALSWLVELGVGAAILFVLTWTEVAGIRFFARRRGWRLHPHAAWQVASHASVGWIVMAWLQLAGLAISTALVYWFNYSPAGQIDWAILPKPIPMTLALSGGLMVGGLVLGLLVFETLIYLGVRACRFANHADTPMPDTGGARIPRHEAPSPAA